MEYNHIRTYVRTIYDISENIYKQFFKNINVHITYESFHQLILEITSEFRNDTHRF